MNDTQDFKILDDFYEWWRVQTCNQSMANYIEQFKREQSPSSVSDAAVKAITALKYRSGTVWQWGANPNNAAQCFTTKREWLEARINYPNVSIWSVTNESGVLFTVGDTVQAKSCISVGRGCTHVIENFYLQHGNLIANGGKFDCDINDLLKPWSFTTKNGTVLNDPEQVVWWIDDNCTAHKIKAKNLATRRPGKSVYTDEKEAREYVRLNTKDYSLQQIQDALNDVGSLNGYVNKKDFLTALTNSK